jgi:phosphocarrier protein HPr
MPVKRTRGDGPKAAQGRAAGTHGGVYHCLAEVVIVNKRGLHARASAAFVKMAEQFDADIQVTKAGHEPVGGSSIMGLLMLGAGPGSTILIETDGPQAEEALDALTGLVEAGFHEDE